MGCNDACTTEWRVGGKLPLWECRDKGGLSDMF
jgi:hypothetical protein